MGDSTGGEIWVLTAQGETAFTRMLSVAHSHAKFFVSWLIAPETESHSNKIIDLWVSIGIQSSKFMTRYVPLDAA